MKTASTSTLLLLMIIYVTLLPALKAQTIRVLPEVTGYLGQDVTLPCHFITASAKGTVTQVQWDLLGPERKIIIVSNPEDGVYIFNTSLKEKVNLTEQSLIIKHLELNNTGTYICRLATYPMGSFQRTTKLIVLANVSNVVITPNATDLIEFNSSVRLTCSSYGSSPSFLWLNGSSEVTACGGEQLTDGGATLTLINVTRYDQGPFRCHVFNVFSHATSDPVELSISYGPDNVNIVGPTSIHAGVITMLYCSSASVPPAKFTWMFQGKPTTVQEPVYVIQSGRNSDSGTYTCTAENTVTGQSQTVHHDLTVTDFSGCDCSAAAK